MEARDWYGRVHDDFYFIVMAIISGNSDVFMLYGNEKLVRQIVSNEKKQKTNNY